MSDDFVLTSRRIAEIPCLMLAPADPVEFAPWALVLHGLGRHKENMLPTLYAFARQGLRAIACDARLHGERPGAQERDARLERDYVGTMAEILEGTSADISRLLDALEVSQAGIHGVSLGGFIAFAAFADEPRLSAAVVAMGSPDWLEPLREQGLAAGHFLYDAVATRSPLERAVQTYPPRPLLLLHGDQDEVVSIQGSLELERRLSPIYRRLEAPLELITYAGLGHHYTDDMVAQSARWLAQHLGEKAR
jgi:pimeloyl-ACP methyl ester carboxylesterase